MRPSVFPVILVVAATMIVTACGSSSTSAKPALTTTPSGPTSTNGNQSAASDEPSVAWVDQMCGEITRLTQAITTGSSDDQILDVTQMLTSFQQMIDRHITAVDLALTGLQANGPSPIAGGDLVQSTIILALQRLQASYQRAKDQAATINPNDLQHLQTALDDVTTTINHGNVELGVATLAMETNPTISDIAHTTPTCQQLNITTTTTTF